MWSSPQLPAVATFKPIGNLGPGRADPGGNGAAVPRARCPGAVARQLAIAAGPAAAVGWAGASWFRG